MFSGVCSLAAIGSMASIAVFRMLSIVKPHLCQSKLKVMSSIAVAFTWISALFWCSFPLFGMGDYVVGGIGSSCTFDFISDQHENKLFIGGLFLFAFGIPLGAILTSYTVLLTALHRRERLICNDTCNNSQSCLCKTDSRKTRIFMLNYRNSRSLSSRLNQQRSSVSGVFRRENTKLRKISQSSFVTNNQNMDIITRVCLLLIVCFLVSWTPYSVVSVIGLSGNSDLLNPYVTLIVGSFAKLSAIYNSVIYFVTMKRFRRQLKQTFVVCRA